MIRIGHVTFPSMENYPLFLTVHVVGLNPTRSTMNTENINKAYYYLHRYCPNCGNDELETTCIGIIFNSLATAKDTNRAYCYKCGWSGIVHDLTFYMPKRGDY